MNCVATGNAFLLLLAFLIYNDGIQTIIKMATAYGTEIGIGQSALIVPSCWCSSWGSLHFPVRDGGGTHRGQAGALPGTDGVRCHQRAGIFHEDRHPVLRSGRPGGHGPGGHSGSEPLALRQHDSAAQVGRILGFFSVFEKFAGIFGPLIFAGTIAATGSSRNAILSVIGFFVVGGALLRLVNVEEGQRAALAPAGTIS